MSPGFSADPFAWQNANLRASTTDRDELARILGEAYANGQLDEQEYEERMESALQIRLLGEVRPLIIDLGEPEKLLAPRPAPGAELAERRAKNREAMSTAAAVWVGVGIMSHIAYVIGVSMGAAAWLYWPVIPIALVTVYLVMTIGRRLGGR